MKAILYIEARGMIDPFRRQPDAKDKRDEKVMDGTGETTARNTYLND